MTARYTPKAAEAGAHSSQCCPIQDHCHMMKSWYAGINRNEGIASSTPRSTPSWIDWVNEMLDIVKCNEHKELKHPLGCSESVTSTPLIQASLRSEVLVPSSIINRWDTHRGWYSTLRNSRDTKVTTKMSEINHTRHIVWYKEHSQSERLLSRKYPSNCQRVCKVLKSS